MKPNKTLASALAVALTAGTITAVTTIGLATSASAATVNTTTAGALGSPVNQAGTSPWGTAADLTLTAVQDGPDIDFTVAGDRGPSTSAFSGFAANSYQIQAFVRLDGAADTRGTQFPGAIGDVAVAVSTSTYASGFTIQGTFANASAGNHTVTLTDIMLNSNSPSSGADFGTPTGFDAYYNPGTTTATIVAGKDWPLAETVNIPRSRDGVDRFQLQPDHRRHGLRPRRYRCDRDRHGRRLGHQRRRRRLHRRVLHHGRRHL